MMLKLLVTSDTVNCNYQDEILTFAWLAWSGYLAQDEFSRNKRVTNTSSSLLLMSYTYFYGCGDGTVIICRSLRCAFYLYPLCNQPLAQHLVHKIYSINVH